MNGKHRIITADVLDGLARLDAESVQCVVTSPPYWGLRDYGVWGQLGLESTPDEYVERMVEVFRGVRRVLRGDGVVFLNLGDSYCNYRPGVYDDNRPHKFGGARDKDRSMPSDGGKRKQRHISGLKEKDRCMIPARVALALQADGWWLRSEIVWAKPNPMPSSVTDRPTDAHEMVYLLTKSARYYWDQEAVRERTSDHPVTSARNSRADQGVVGAMDGHGDWGQSGNGGFDRSSMNGRNIRTVWTIPTQAYPDAHFATFPEELARRCVAAGTSEKGCCPQCGTPWVRVVERERSNQSNAARAGTVIDGKGHATDQVRDDHDIRNGPCVSAVTTGWRLGCPCPRSGDDHTPCAVLDPFCGSGTTLAVACRMGRDAVGIELSPEYVKLAERRIGTALNPSTYVDPNGGDAGPLFADAVDG